MAIIEFEEWLEALVDEERSESAECDDGEVWEAIGGKSAG
jgi:hypothetical protein